MGEVYRARDTTLGRDVALKFMLHAPRLEAPRLDRLQREARTLAALNHPNIVTIHQIGDADGVPFLVLEWMGGGSLADQRGSGPRSIDEFLRVALPVADALGAAHEHGIVHRDVKPGNVLVTADGRVKLADFGLATELDLDRDATRTAAIVGTVAYMSPEQASGAEIGPASDVYSFGVLAYELLAGERPAGQPLRERRPGALAGVIDRCLDRDPRARFANGADLARALRAAATESRTTATAASRPAGAQPITFCRTSDGMSIAYSAVGTGPVIVRVLGHLTHLEMEWEWPDLRRFWEALAERHTVVRYDGRGMGLSDRYAGAFTEDTRQRDLDAVIEAVRADRVILLGISEGGWTSAMYADQHPARVSHLILYGAYCRGALARPGYDVEENNAFMILVRKGWGRDTPAFRQVFTSNFFKPDADPRLIAHFNEMQRVSADADTVVRYYESLHSRGDGRELFSRVTAPTLVIHGRDDLAVRADEGRLLASIIPGAQLVLLPSGSHYFPTDTAIAVTAAEAITRFLQEGP
jgi:pimeloyl-ACP methyl ester carboxylesterase